MKLFRFQKTCIVFVSTLLFFFIFPSFVSAEICCVDIDDDNIYYYSGKNECSFAIGQFTVTKDNGWKDRYDECLAVAPQQGTICCLSSTTHKTYLLNDDPQHSCGVDNGSLTPVPFTDCASNVKPHGKPNSASTVFTKQQPVVPKLQIPIPGVKFSDLQVVPGQTLSVPWIAEYLVGLYKFSIFAAAIVSTIMIMVGGFMWLTSAGNQVTIGRAKEYIGGSLVGLLIVLGAYMILYTINPDLARLNSVDLIIVSAIDTEGALNEPLTPQGDVKLVSGGSCGGMKTQSGIYEQCKDASPELSTFLTCLSQTLPKKSVNNTGFSIAGISAKAGWEDCQNGVYPSSKQPCPHTKNSCHYGGQKKYGCTGSYAVDIVDDDGRSGYIDPDVALQIIEASQECGMNAAYGPDSDPVPDQYRDKKGHHNDHVHVSVGFKCGCK